LKRNPEVSFLLEAAKLSKKRKGKRKEKQQKIAYLVQDTAN